MVTIFSVQNILTSVLDFFSKYYKIVLSLLLIYFIYKIPFINNLFKTDTHIKLKQNEDLPSSNISDIQASIFANQLDEAMNEDSFDGTNGDLIFDVFENVNPNATILIYNSFGLREYNKTFGNSSSLYTTKHNLIEWLKNELSITDKSYLMAVEKMRPVGLL